MTPRFPFLALLNHLRKFQSLSSWSFFVSHPAFLLLKSIYGRALAPEVLKLRVSDALDAMKSLKDIFDREAKGVKAVELAEHAAAGRKSALLEAIRGMLGVFKASTLDSVTKLGA